MDDYTKPGRGPGHLRQSWPWNRNPIVRKEGAVVKIGKWLRVKMDGLVGHTRKDLVITIPKYMHERGVRSSIQTIFIKLIVAIVLC